MSTKRIKITFKANGDGLLECKGGGTFKCLGQVGRQYPKDLTIKGEEGVDKWKEKRSDEATTATDVIMMPWAILIWGQKGIYIHGWPGEASVAGYDGGPAGCIHVQSDNATNDAKTLYDWVDGRTRVEFEYPW